MLLELDSGSEVKQGAHVTQIRLNIHWNQPYNAFFNPYYISNKVEEYNIDGASKLQLSSDYLCIHDVERYSVFNIIEKRVPYVSIEIINMGKPLCISNKLLHY